MYVYVPCYCSTTEVRKGERSLERELQGSVSHHKFLTSLKVTSIIYRFCEHLSLFSTLHMFSLVAVLATFLIYLRIFSNYHLVLH